MNVSPGLANADRFEWRVDILADLRIAHGAWLRPSLEKVELLRHTHSGIAVLNIVSGDGQRTGWVPLDFIDGDVPGEKMFPRAWSKERCVRELLAMDPLVMARSFSGFLFTLEGWCEIVARYEGTGDRIQA